MKSFASKSIINIMLIIAVSTFISLIVNSCDSYNSSPYERMYKDSFDILLSRVKAPNHPDKLDTLYTEMYIALKTSENSLESQEIVLNRVERLMQMDTIIENQIHYLDAKLIILSLQGKEKDYWDTAYKSYLLYPVNSLERLSSLTAYYKKINQNTDSATYYFNKTINIAEGLLTSNDSETRMKAIVTKISNLCLFDCDDENKKFIQEQLRIETDPDIIELLQQINNDYNSFKHEIRNQQGI